MRRDITNTRKCQQLIAVAAAAIRFRDKNQSKYKMQWTRALAAIHFSFSAGRDSSRAHTDSLTHSRIHTDRHNGTCSIPNNGRWYMAVSTKWPPTLEIEIFFFFTFFSCEISTNRRKEDSTKRREKRIRIEEAQRASWKATLKIHWNSVERHESDRKRLFALALLVLILLIDLWKYWVLGRKKQKVGSISMTETTVVTIFDWFFCHFGDLRFRRTIDGVHRTIRRNLPHLPNGLKHDSTEPIPRSWISCIIFQGVDRRSLGVFISISFTCVQLTEYWISDKLLIELS